MGKNKVVVVMPAYNAESTLEKTVNDIPEGVVDEIILVDDASKDSTVEIARNYISSYYSSGFNGINMETSTILGEQHYAL